MLVLAPFGVFESWWGPILAFFVQVLVGMAFGTVIFGVSARMTSEQGFGLIFRIGVVPLMLFSGAFFPIANLGVVLEWLARLTPLWHGVHLSRIHCLDTMAWSLAGRHLLVLAAGMRSGGGVAIGGL